MLMKSYQGFTLFEQLLALTVLALITSLALPNLHVFITKLRVDNEISQLHRLLLAARHNAIHSNQEVTICPIDKNFNCHHDWQQKIIIFHDKNNNQSYNPDVDGEILRMKNKIPSADRLQFRKGQNRIKFSITGSTSNWGANGTFKYCPKYQQNLSRAIVIAISGRIYSSSDNDNDGKDELRNGREIFCRA